MDQQNSVKQSPKTSDETTKSKLTNTPQSIHGQGRKESAKSEGGENKTKEDAPAPRGEQAP